MSEIRKILAFTLGFIVLVGNVDCQDSENDTSSNETDLVPTYTTGIEQLLQGLQNVIPSGDDSNNSSGSNDGPLGESFSEILDLFADNFHAIFPGTLWCGAGNVASSEEDVGVFDGTDDCCRTHDNCPDNIGAGKTKGILYNDGIFTRSACSCDHEFYSCLKNVSTVVSQNIGSTYFNILRPQCFKRDYPIESCAEYGDNRIVRKKCLKYNLDETQNKTLEWFDNPDF